MAGKAHAYGTLYGVGVGPGDPRLLTLRAVEVLRAVDIIFHVAGPRSRESVSERIVDSIEGCCAERVELVFSMSRDPEERRASVAAAARRVAAALTAGKNCAFTTIGDPLIYSTFGYLQRHVREALPDVAIEIVPGITAFQAAAAAWGQPLVEDDEVLSIIPKRESDEKRSDPLDACDTAVLLKTYRDRTEAIAALRARLTPKEVLYAARVGLPDEKIVTDLSSLESLPIDYLSLLIAKRGAHV